MLSEKEKEEMLSDVNDPKRKLDFSAAKKKAPVGSRSLDEFMSFLMNLQEIFSPFSIPQNITKTANNKL